MCGIEHTAAPDLIIIARQRTTIRMLVRLPNQGMFDAPHGNK